MYKSRYQQTLAQLQDLIKWIHDNKRIPGRLARTAALSDEQVGGRGSQYLSINNIYNKRNIYLPDVHDIYGSGRSIRKKD